MGVVAEARDFKKDIFPEASVNRGHESLSLFGHKETSQILCQKFTAVTSALNQAPMDPESFWPLEKPTTKGDIILVESLIDLLWILVPKSHFQPSQHTATST